MLSRVLVNSSFGTTVDHYQAQHVEPDAFDDQGRPDYLSSNSGFQDSGVEYIPNPENPLRGMFCPAPRRPVQEAAGVFYQAQMELYLTENLGDIFVLDDRYPKRQDAFEIAGRRYYAVCPATPCTLGDTTACWKIELSLERYPVQN